MTRTGRLIVTVLAFTASAILAGIIVGCTAEGPTAPDPVSQAPAPVAAAPVPAPAPTVAPVAGDPTTGPSFEGRILPFAGWDVKNTSGNISQMTAYYTSFDNQSLSLGSKTYTMQPNDSFRDTFNKTCVQVDLTYGAPGDAPFLFGYIEADGSVVKQITEKTRYDCTPRDCKLSEWKYGEWSKWVVSQDGKTRTRTRTNTRVVTDPAYRDGKACGPLTEEQSETEKCVPSSQLKLTADKNDPSSGNSFFKYYVYKVKPGLFNDELIFSENLPKGAVRYISAPDDGAKYYVQYDSEIFRRDYADAKCSTGVTAAWNPTLEFVCSCDFRGTEQ